MVLHSFMRLIRVGNLVSFIPNLVKQSLSIAIRLLLLFRQSSYTLPACLLSGQPKYLPLLQYNTISRDYTLQEVSHVSLLPKPSYPEAVLKKVSGMKSYAVAEVDEGCGSVI